MSFINKLHNNLPGYLLHIKDRLQGNMLKPLSGIKIVMPISRSTINSVNITSAYNNINITMDHRRAVWMEVLFN